MNEFERIQEEVFRLKVKSGRMVAISVNPEYAERLRVAEKEYIDEHGWENASKNVSPIELRIDESQEEDYKMILL